MKYSEWKKQFKTDEEERLYYKLHQVVSYSCPKCDEMLSGIDLKGHICESIQVKENMENQTNENPINHTNLPFDLSILTDKSKHAGFFLVLFLEDGKVQAHYDKMDGIKFGYVVNAVIDLALKQDPANADSLIAQLQEWKRAVLKKQQEVAFEELETVPLKQTDEIMDKSKDKQVE